MTNVSMTTPTISKTTEKTISAEEVHEIQLKAMGKKARKKDFELRLFKLLFPRFPMVFRNNLLTIVDTERSFISFFCK